MGLSTGIGYGLGTISAWNNVSCYAIFVENPAKSSAGSCYNNSGGVEISPSTFKGFMAAGSTAYIDVDPGENQTIALVALESTLDCFDIKTFSASKYSQSSPPMIVAKTTVNLEAGINEVPMNGSIGSGVELKTCDFVQEPIGGTNITEADVDVSNGIIIIKGTFTATSNTVSVNGESVSIISQSANSIEIPINGITALLLKGLGNLTVNNAFGAASFQVSDLTVLGAWNASSNTPILSNGSGSQAGEYYIVSTTGATSIDGESGWNEGDWIVFNGTVWEKLAFPAASGDNLGNHTLGSTLQTNNLWISNDGDAEGIHILANGNVGVGLASPTEILTVDGNINVTIGNDICIDGGGCLSAAVAGGGEINTASNVGGTSLFKAKSGTNLEFKGLTNTADITLTSNANDISIGISSTNVANQLLRLNGLGALPVIDGSNLTGLNTNAGTICSAGEYLDGDGACKATPVDTTTTDATTLQGRNISAILPGNNEVLTWNGINWTPLAIPTAPMSAFDSSSNVSGSSINMNGFGFTQIDSLQSPGGSFLGLYADDFIKIKTNSIERMRITNGGNIGIGTTTPETSAALEISSTDKGFLPPRMTNTQMVSISTPAEGLIVYNNDTSRLNIRKSSKWIELAESDPANDYEECTESNGPFLSSGTPIQFTAGDSGFSSLISCDGSEIQVTAPGVYQVTGSVRLLNTTTSPYYLSITRNSGDSSNELDMIVEQLVQPRPDTKVSTVNFTVTLHSPGGGTSHPLWFQVDNGASTQLTKLRLQITKIR